MCADAGIDSCNRIAAADHMSCSGSASVVLMFTNQCALLFCRHAWPFTLRWLAAEVQARTGKQQGAVEALVRLHGICVELMPQASNTDNDFSGQFSCHLEQIARQRAHNVKGRAAFSEAETADSGSCALGPARYNNPSHRCATSDLVLVVSWARSMYLQSFKMCS